MRMKTPIDGERLANHWTYSAWKYIVLVVAAVFGWDLIFSTTEYHSPENLRVDVYIQTATASQEMIDAFLEPIWQQTVPDMETVQGATLLAGGADYETTMQLSTYMATGQGDIYFLTEQYFKMFAAQGSFLPLEDLVEDGTLQVADVDVRSGYVAVVEDYDEQGNPIGAAQHLYGIPLESFYGFVNGMHLDNRGLYAAVLLNNQNDEHVIPFFDALLQAGRGEKEQEIAE